MVFRSMKPPVMHGSGPLRRLVTTTLIEQTSRRGGDTPALARSHPRTGRDHHGVASQAPSICDIPRVLLSPAGAGRLPEGSGPFERAGGDEGVVCGPGDVAAPVAVGPVGGLVQAVGDVGDACGEFQDARVVGEQLEFGSVPRRRRRASSVACFAAVCSASDAPASRSWALVVQAAHRGVPSSLATRVN